MQSIQCPQLVTIDPYFSLQQPAKTFNAERKRSSYCTYGMSLRKLPIYVPLHLSRTTV